MVSIALYGLLSSSMDSLRYFGSAHVAQFLSWTHRLGRPWLLCARFNQCVVFLREGVYLCLPCECDRLRDTSSRALIPRLKEQVLVRYLPPALINDIFEGKVLATKPCLHLRI